MVFRLTGHGVNRRIALQKIQKELRDTGKPIPGCGLGWGPVLDGSFLPPNTVKFYFHLFKVYLKVDKKLINYSNFPICGWCGSRPRILALFGCVPFFAKPGQPFVRTAAQFLISVQLYRAFAFLFTDIINSFILMIRIWSST